MQYVSLSLITHFISLFVELSPEYVYSSFSSTMFRSDQVWGYFQVWIRCGTIFRCGSGVGLFSGVDQVSVVVVCSVTQNHFWNPEWSEWDFKQPTNGHIHSDGWSSLHYSVIWYNHEDLIIIIISPAMIQQVSNFLRAGDDVDVVYAAVDEHTSRAVFTLCSS